MPQVGTVPVRCAAQVDAHGCHVRTGREMQRRSPQLWLCWYSGPERPAEENVCCMAYSGSVVNGRQLGILEDVIRW